MDAVQSTCTLVLILIQFRNNPHQLLILSVLISILSFDGYGEALLFHPLLVMAAHTAGHVELDEPIPEVEFGVSIMLYDSGLGRAYLKRLSRFNHRRSREFTGRYR